MKGTTMTIGLLLTSYRAIIPSFFVHASSSKRSLASLKSYNNTVPQSKAKNAIHQSHSQKTTYRQGEHSERMADPDKREWEGSLDVDAEDDPWKKVGGIAVNEKKRTGAVTTNPSSLGKSGFDPVRYKAHLYHALEGLDRYPLYLSRWNNENDMDALEQALEAQLHKVQRQRKQVQQYRAEMERLLEDFLESSPKGPSYRALIQRPTSWETIQRDILDPQFAKAMEQSHKRQFQRKSQKNIENPYIIPLPWQHENSIRKEDTMRHDDIVLEASALEPIMDQEAPDVYSLPVVQPVYCQQLLEYLRDFSIYRYHHHQQQQQQQQQQTTDVSSSSPTTSLNVRWIDLDHAGLSWFNDLLLVYVVQPIARHLFVADTTGDYNGDEQSMVSVQESAWPSSLDWRQGYLAGYTAAEQQATSVTPRQGLTAHTDDSEVTLNLSLNGGAFTGGDLELYGLRREVLQNKKNDNKNVPPSRIQSPDVYTPVAGRALLHAGRYLHAVSPLTNGDRFAVILWTRSWSGIRSKQCPCCWLQRRRVSDAVAATDPPSSPQQTRQRHSIAMSPSSTCICGASWN